jgi:hypothetical protein
MNTQPKNYNDALYFASSYLTKKESFHLTSTQERILRKLLHYNSKNSKITYSNELIAEHTFTNFKMVEREIPKLVSMGYIKSFVTLISDGDMIKSRRTININWEKFNEIINLLPSKFIEIDEPQLEEEPKTEGVTEGITEGVIELPEAVDSYEDDTDGIEITLTNKKIAFIPNNMLEYYDNLGYKEKMVLLTEYSANSFLEELTERFEASLEYNNRILNYKK